MRTYLNETSYPRLNDIARSICFGVFFMFLLFLGGSFLVPFFGAKWERFVYGISGTIGAFFAAWVFLKIEKRSLKDIGLVWQRGTIGRFLAGLLLGTAIFAIMIGVLISFTDLRLERTPSGISLSGAFWYLAIIPLALMEEVAFRSYPFLKLNKVFGLRITQVIVAVAFAAYHIIGGWDIKIAFLGPGIWAFVYGLAAIWSGGIALPTGIHAALNITQSLVGMKSDNYESIWKLDFKEGTAPQFMAMADNIGFILQFIVLAAAIVLTEYYIRKRHGFSYTKNKHGSLEDKT